MDRDTKHVLVYRPLLYVALILVVVFLFPFGWYTIAVLVAVIIVGNIDLILYLKKKFFSESE